ncbi:restriction endonuclease subunit S [Cohnella xylanilytica]|uniref:Restriction endonuclease subunit S n=1 Tax=Cohnella xylanilytica TaxID=557555 RepID=A0A841TTM4_9BACL|nr:restriction endonuclease subunit S [Cohnella xylanilytica]MBB6691039.1 restriction endonuclease subunit S [Cohnella xylanilytica]
MSKDDRGKVEIPNEWKVESLGNLFEFYGGMPFSRSALGDSGFLYLHYGDIHKRGNGKFDVAKDSAWLPRVDISIEEVKENALLHDGDLVFADASEDYDGIGKSVVIENKSGETFVSGLHTIIAKGSSKELDLNFKRYFLSPPFVRNQFIRIATGATVYGISKANIKKINVLVPPLSEQRKIASILSSVDEAIEKTEAIIEQTEKVKKGLMQRLLTKGIGHTRFQQTDIGEIPEEWKINHGFIKIVSGYGFQASDYVEKGIPLVRINNIGYGEMLEDDFIYLPTPFATEYQKFLLKENDIIMALNRPITNGKLKIAIIKNKHVPSILYQRIGKLVFDTTKYHPEYIFLYLQSPQFLKQLEITFVGSDQPFIKNSEFAKLPFGIPSLQEQKKIAEILGSVDSKLRVERDKYDKLLRSKNALMQVLLTGKVRVKVKEEAEVVKT